MCYFDYLAMCCSGLLLQSFRLHITPASCGCRSAEAQVAAEQECRLKLSAMQSYMFELSNEVSLIELALELAEARLNIMCAASGMTFP